MNHQNQSTKQRHNKFCVGDVVKFEFDIFIVENIESGVAKRFYTLVDDDGVRINHVHESNMSRYHHPNLNGVVDILTSL